ncbi:MAG: rRNA pseudouridine synthase [Pirellulales bacterium]|nr:rRNA pseudouridine synthase [Pirellulales bacterium]
MSKSPRHPTDLRSDQERLQKVLAAAGIGSRRECEAFILLGRVEVDREVVCELGTRVDRSRQEIRVDGELLPYPKNVYFAVHKPPGVVSTARDPTGRPRVIDLVPQSAGRVFNVGRLDASSEGLILVTNDGTLANQLTHPRHGIEKTYHVTVAGHVTTDTLNRLRHGTYLAEGLARMTRIRIKNLHKKSTVLEIVLSEGKNREIRRLLARVGHKVLRLVRVAIGPLRLGQLPRGGARPLAPTEVAALLRAVRGKGGGDPKQQSASIRPRRPRKGS